MDVGAGRREFDPGHQVLIQGGGFKFGGHDLNYGTFGSLASAGIAGNSAFLAFGCVSALAPADWNLRFPGSPPFIGA